MRICSFLFFLVVLVSTAYAESTDKWEGFYIGGSAIAQKANASATNTSGSATWVPSGDTVDFSDNTLRAGVQMGYQLTSGNFLYGLEASMIPGTMTKRIQSKYTAWHQLEMSIENQTLLGARLGYVWNDWLFFGKAGYAGGKVNFKTIDTAFSQNYYDQSAWQNGWHAGAGVEYALDEHVIIGIDYSHADLGSKTQSKTTTPTTEEFKLKAKTDTLALRLNFLF